MKATKEEVETIARMDSRSCARQARRRTRNASAWTRTRTRKLRVNSTLDFDNPADKYSGEMEVEGEQGELCITDNGDVLRCC